jgi:hypothetical protein
MKRLILIALLAILTSCAPNNKGTSTGNPLVTLSMASSGSAATVVKSFLHKLFSLLIPQSVAKTPPPLMKDANNNDIVISDFWISLGEIEFKYSETAPIDEVNGSEVEFAGPFTINMLAATPESLASGMLVNSEFRRIKYKLKTASTLPIGAPGGLSGSGIYISGTVNGNPFTFNATSEVEISVAGTNLVGAQNSDTLLLQIKIASLIKKIDFSVITSPTNTAINEGNRPASLCPQINSSAVDLYNCMMSGFSSEANVGRDINGDGEFEATETTVK